MPIQYLKGVISNVKTHQKLHSSNNNEKSEAYTKYINIFDINGEGMKYESTQPASISDDDLISIAYKNGLFGKKVKGMWNCSNFTYTGDMSWPYFFLSGLVFMVSLLIIFFDPLIGLESFSVFFKSSDLLGEVLLIISIFGGLFGGLFLILGINTRNMINTVKSL